ncbi:hypothetical protein [Spirosoma areae]
MDKLRKQLIDGFRQMMQVVNWGDLLGRTFRPVITPNSLLAESIRSGLLGYFHASYPIYLRVSPVAVTNRPYVSQHQSA